MNKNSMKTAYDDIIHSPHYRSKTRKAMSLTDRAAQFAPFSALEGHEAAIDETARITDMRVETDETVKIEINRALFAAMEQRKRVMILHFIPDEKKAGGVYQTTIDTIQSIKEFECIVVLGDGTQIPIDAIDMIEEL